MEFDPVLINLAFTVFGGIITYAVFFNNANKDSKNAGQNAGQISSDLGYLKKGVEEINHKMEVQDARYLDLVQRMSKVEASAKQAHHRLDSIMGPGVGPKGEIDNE